MQRVSSYDNLKHVQQTLHNHFEPFQYELKYKESGELICVQPIEKPIAVKEMLSNLKEVLKKTKYVKLFF